MQIEAALLPFVPDKAFAAWPADRRRFRILCPDRKKAKQRVTSDDAATTPRIEAARAVMSATRDKVFFILPSRDFFFHRPYHVFQIHFSVWISPPSALP